MILPKSKTNAGFSLLELVVAMTIMLILLGLVSTLLVSTLGIKSRESRRTDALTSAQAALNLLSHEISSSGYGLTNNGLVLADSNSHRIHCRANIINSDSVTNAPGEDVAYYLDSASGSIIRYDRYRTPQTSVVVNRISDVTFQYFDYTSGLSAPVQKTVPSLNTGRVRIILTVEMEPVTGQPDNQTVTFSSDVTLRNSTFMLNQY